MVERMAVMKDYLKVEHLVGLKVAKMEKSLVVQMAALKAEKLVTTWVGTKVALRAALTVELTAALTVE